MANRERGEVTLRAGGTSYVMRFGINEMCDLEDEFGRSINEIVAMLGRTEDFRISHMRALVAAGLRGALPDMDAAQAGEIMNEAGMTVVSEAVQDAFNLAFPADEKDKDTGERAARPPKAKR